MRLEAQEFLFKLNSLSNFFTEFGYNQSDITLEVDRSLFHYLCYITQEMYPSPRRVLAYVPPEQLYNWTTSIENPDFMSQSVAFTRIPDMESIVIPTPSCLIKVIPRS